MNANEAFDDGPLLDDSGPVDFPPPVEHERRRPGWTRGDALIASDGSTWFLPRLDAAFYPTQPDLAARLARFAAGAGGGLPGGVEAIRDLGRELLAANYHLHWLDTMFIVGLHVSQVADFALAVSDALVDAAEGCAPGTWGLFEADSTPGSALTLYHN